MADQSAHATHKPFAIVARFHDPAALYHACEELRHAGYKNFDAHSPFPVHGLEIAMGVGPSKVPWISLAGGIIGGLTGFGLQTWVHLSAYPQNISGKSLFAYQAMVPIVFELTILLTAFGTFFGMWGLNNLPQFFHPVMQHSKFVQTTDDGFFISVESTDPLYGSDTTGQLLARLGGLDIEEVQP